MESSEDLCQIFELRNSYAVLRDLASCDKIQGLLTEKCVGWTTLKGIIHEAGDIMKNPASLKSYTLNNLVELPDYSGLLIYEFGGKECINILSSAWR